MDKINLENWNNVFEKAEQQVVFASDRYNDFQFRFEEPDLASGSIKTLVTPGMQLTEFEMHAGQPFQLVDGDAKETAESVFVLDGNSESRFHNLSSPLSFNKNHHNLQYNCQFGGDHIIS